MKTKESVLGLLLACSLLFVAGCSAVGKMPVEMDERGKMMAPPSGKALVYVIRPASTGGAVGMPVTCNDTYLGKTGGKRYLVAVLDPGSYLFTSKAENTSELAIVIEGDMTYYLEQKIKMGLFKARANLERLSDAEGREKLAKCSLSNDLNESVQTYLR